ncbi:MAG: hypothetical protein ACLUIE_00025 [Parabacteroides merdae]
MFCFIFCFPDAQKYTNEQYLVISQWYMDVSVLKVAASGATSGGNDPPPIRDRHVPDTPIARERKCSRAIYHSMQGEP